MLHRLRSERGMQWFETTTLQVNERLKIIRYNVGWYSHNQKN